MLFKDRLTEEQQKIIKKHLNEIPVKLGALARDLGIEVSVATLAYGKSGQISPSSSAKSGFAIRVNRHESKERQRFTLAHEIAHFLLHKDKIKSGITESVLYRADGITNAEEVEANRLAAEIVMPAAEIRRRISGINTVDEETVKRFAQDFSVSAPAMQIRLGLK